MIGKNRLIFTLRIAFQEEKAILNVKTKYLPIINAHLYIIIMLLFVHLQINVCLKTYIISKCINKMVYGINL